ncbi:MAG: lysine exporter LysO family protein [Rikenellaceae bacterium]
MKGSIIIVAFFFLGVLLARFDLLSAHFFEFDYSQYTLYLLMFSVGISVGADIKSLFVTIKKHGFRMFLPPLATIFGTLLGCLLLGLIWDGRSVAQCMAVGSGFGYYSLSSIFITQICGAELGTVALISNISREIITLLCAPFIVYVFGKIALICSGGATTMDTTLPIITRFSGNEYVVIAIFHGFIVDFTVPFLVTLFASL